jgi:hypothetical protein
MDENLPVNPGTQREDSFDIAVRGFNRQQVNEYMARSTQLLATLEQHLAVALADVQRARAAAQSAQAEVTELRTAQTEAKPVHAEVSDRMSQILRLAAEEADQERGKAEHEIAALRADTQAECERLVGAARAAAEHDLTTARTTAENELATARETAAAELAQARETAENELAEARSSAEHQVTSAREEANRLRLDSVRHAEDLLDDAQRRAGAVNDVSNQRLETLTATHGEAVLRLGQIRDVLADLLDRDAAAGSLSKVVEAVMAPEGGRLGPDEHEPHSQFQDSEHPEPEQPEQPEPEPVEAEHDGDEPAGDEAAVPVTTAQAPAPTHEPDPVTPPARVVPAEIDLRVAPDDERLVAGSAGAPNHR